MFVLNSNVRDLRRAFGIARCGDDDAKVFLRGGVLRIESARPLTMFGTAAIRSCGMITDITGDSALTVCTDDVLDVLSAGRVDDIAVLKYNGEVFEIVIRNVKSEIRIVDNEDVRASKIMDMCSFNCTNKIDGRDFIIMANVSDRAKAPVMLVSMKDTTFSIRSIDGKYKSAIEQECGMPGNLGARFSTEFLLEFSKQIRAGDVLSVSCANNAPMMLAFETNGWNMGYIVAPRVDID